jgi:UDP-2,3-diacylglucosamine pyrophosphatase LpxH
LRALVISDTHFGTWTGRDLLREPDSLALVAPHLDDVDEVIILGDLCDFLFARIEDAIAASKPFLQLVSDRLQGKRAVFLPGNHDYHVVVRDREALRTARLTGHPERERGRSQLSVHSFIADQLAGVELELRYPTYTFGRVLCTHGHHLDPHARRTGSLGDKLLGRLIWSIACGGAQEPRTIDDYEAATTLLTEELYTLAQLPHGTTAQRKVYTAAHHLAEAARVIDSPAEFVERVARRALRRTQPDRTGTTLPESMYRAAHAEEDERMESVGAPVGKAPSYPLARASRPSDPREHALRAFSRAVVNLGWDRQADQIVFAHTHQPLAGATVPGGPVRYWNTGSWIWEPDVSSRHAYERYLRYAWPGTAVLIDTDDAEPRLLELRRDLNPLRDQ